MYLTDNTWPIPPHNLTLLTLSAKVSVMCSPGFIWEWKQRAGAENILLSLSMRYMYTPPLCLMYCRYLGETGERQMDEWRKIYRRKTKERKWTRKQEESKKIGLLTIIMLLAPCSVASQASGWCWNIDLISIPALCHQCYPVSNQSDCQKINVRNTIWLVKK